MSDESDRATLYEYAVVFHPGEDDHERARVVVGPEHTLAQTEQGAVMKVARAIPEEYIDREENIEILIRPFG